MTDPKDDFVMSEFVRASKLYDAHSRSRRIEFYQRRAMPASRGESA